jgi:prepilin-type N-terminal cleavage/methylation domain-containing protein
MARFSSRAFTLIELLIVIAIIGILMALLFPAVQGAIDAARKAQAQNDVTQIATAITAYVTEYGKLPGTVNSDAAQDVDSQLVKILTADSSSTNDNPRKITFIEIGTFKLNSKSGTNAAGNFVDPWGGQYRVAMDGDYDNTLTGQLGVAPGPVTNNIRKTVAVWNVAVGKDDTQKKRRSVTTW